MVLSNNISRLTDKWIAGAEFMRHIDVDAVMVLGSDDLVSTSYLTTIANKLNSGEHVIVANSLYYLDAVKIKAIRATCTRVGAGRVISAELLDRLEWRPWELGKRHCDSSMDRTLHVVIPRSEWAFIEGEVLLDVKTDINMWSFYHVSKMDHFGIDPEVLVNKYFPFAAKELLTAWKK